MVHQGELCPFRENKRIEQRNGKKLSNPAHQARAPRKKKQLREPQDRPSIPQKGERSLASALETHQNEKERGEELSTPLRRGRSRLCERGEGRMHRKRLERKKVDKGFAFLVKAGKGPRLV